MSMYVFTAEDRVKSGEKAKEATDIKVSLRPKHCVGYDEFSREWYVRQDEAFSAAMRAHPDERPIQMVLRNG